MKYRALSSTGDYTFGQGNANFLINTPAAVGQAVKTRLLLMQGEWFLDVTDGTPYASQVLGKNTQTTYDQAIRQRILQTEGVTGIASYSSSVVKRSLKVAATIDTLYGQTTVTATLVPSS